MGQSDLNCPLPVSIRIRLLFTRRLNKVCSYAMARQSFF